jgi:acylphosphatase
MIQRTVFFSGQVQGVGFRYTTSDIASRFAVTGTVRNLADGRVELVVEGDAQEIDSFLAAVAIEFGGNILSTDVTERVASGEYGSFSIAH